MEPQRKHDEEIQQLRKRKSERRKALQEAHEELKAATRKLLLKLNSENGKKPSPQQRPQPEPIPDEVETEEQEA
jgi:hypothetical protein